MNSRDSNAGKVVRISAVNLSRATWLWSRKKGVVEIVVAIVLVPYRISFA